MLPDVEPSDSLENINAKAATDTHGLFDVNMADYALSSLSRPAISPTCGEHLSFGFRLVNMASVPEPGPLVLPMLASGVLGIRRRRLTRIRTVK